MGWKYPIFLFVMIFCTAEVFADEHVLVENTALLCEDTSKNVAASIKQYVQLTGRTATMTSPCYSDMYGEEYPEKIKYIHLNPSTDPSEIIHGYRFTIIEGDAATKNVTVKHNDVTEVDGLTFLDTFYVEITAPLFGKPYSARVDEEDHGGLFRLDIEADLESCPDDKIAECAAKNGASCERSGILTYQCVCTAFWKGDNCEIDVDECTDNTDGCDDASTNCVNSDGGYTCNCKTGYANLNDKTCTAIQCVGISHPTNGNSNCNGATNNYNDQCVITCNNGFFLSQGVGTVTCGGITVNGVWSSLVQHVCTAITCPPISNPGNGVSSCSSGNSNFGQSCAFTCNNGFSLTAGTSPATCGNNAVTPGVVGSWNTVTPACTDDNECEGTTDPCAGSSGTCVNTVGSYTCSCPEGFALAADGVSCNPIQCVGISHPTNGNSNCNGATNNYNDQCVITCNNGFFLSQGAGTVTCGGTTVNGVWSSLVQHICTAITCSPIENPANGASSCNGENSNFNAKCTFECNPGFSLTAGTSPATCGNNAVTPGVVGSWNTVTPACTDDNECEGTTDPCAGSVATCVNTVGSYTCSCPTGYELADDSVTCIDVDECKPGFDNNCESGTGTCVNNVGSYVCNCSPGYQQGTSTTTCIDINECLSQSTHNCALGTGTCTNTGGGYTCSCFSGYFLEPGTKPSCQNVDECDNSTLNNCDGVTADCVDTKGSYYCVCKEGYSNAVEGKCSDNNECDLNTDECDEESTNCINLVPSYRCECKSGFDNLTDNKCTNINECLDPDSYCNTATGEICEDTIGSYKCLCNDPLYRDSGENTCDYYCDATAPGDCSALETVGYIREAYTGKYYDKDQDTTWRMPALGVKGWKFTILSFDLERTQDWVIFGAGVDDELHANYFAQFSGTLEDLTEEEFKPGTTRNGSVIIVSNTQPFVRFTSDPTQDIPHTGMLIRYEADGEDCTDDANSACQRGSDCVDTVFDYFCSPCPSGWEGKHCNTDIDECNPNQCPDDSTCENTDGSYNCDCNNGFITSNSSLARPIQCKPHILMEKPRATVIGSNSATIVFPITYWETFSDYIVNFEIKYNGKAITSNSVSIVLTDLTPYTEYTVEVLIQTPGPKFAEAEVDVASNTFTFETLAIVPPAPASPIVTVIQPSGRLSVEWTHPDPTGIGETTSYQIKCVCADCTTYPDGRNKMETFIVNENFDKYVITGLTPYRTYNVTLAVRTAAGWGPESTVVSGKTGTTINGWEYTATVDPHNAQQSAITSTNYPGNYGNAGTAASTFRYWKYLSNSECAGTKVNVIHFVTEKDEDILYIGQSDQTADVRIFDTYNGLKKYNLSDTIAAGSSYLLTRDAKNATDEITYFVFHPDSNNNRRGFEVEILLDCNACDMNPCLNGGSCSDGPFNYACECSATDYQGADCRYPKITVSNFDCVPAARSITCTWSETALWMNDETVTAGYSLRYNDATAEQDFVSTKSMTVEGLEPYSRYEMELMAKYTSQFDGLSLPRPNANPKNYTTLQAKPEAPVQNIQITSITSTGFVVTFAESPKPNGPPKYTVATTDGSFNSAGLTVLTETVTGLKPYTEYNVTVRVDNDVDGLTSEVVPVMTKTDVPFPVATTSVNSTKVTETTFEICWTITVDSTKPNPGPTTYTVTATDPTGAAPLVTAISDEDASCVVVTGLDEGRQYAVTVQPKTADANGVVSSSITVKTAESAPGVVATFIRESETTDSITLGFSPPTDLEKNGVLTQYSITWPGLATPVLVPATETSYLVTGLTVYTSYSFTIKAWNGAFEGAATTKTFSTADGVPGEVVLDGTNHIVGDETITLNWSQPAGTVVGNYIYDVVFNDVTYTTTDTTFTFQDLTPATDYTFTITTRTQADGNTGEPVTVSLSTTSGKPTPVVNLSVVSKTATTISITWEEPETTNGDIVEYKIKWTGPDTDAEATVPESEKNYTLTGLTPETEYNITVQASNDKATSDPITIPEETANGLLNKPTFVVESDGSDVRVTITPGPSVDGVTLKNYFIQYSEQSDRCLAAADPECTANKKTETFNTSTYLFTDLKAWRIYEMKVVVTSNYDRETISDETIYETAVTAPPQGTISVGSITSTSAMVSWEGGTPLTGPTANQLVFNGTVYSTSPGELVSLTPATEYVVILMSFITSDTNLSTNTTATFTTPAIAQPPTPGGSTSNSITITWPEDVENPNGEVNISIVTVNCVSTPSTGGCPDPIKRNVVKALNVTIDNLLPGTTYDITVTSVANGVTGDPSDPQRITTLGGVLGVADGTIPLAPGDIGGTQITIPNPCLDENNGFVTNEGVLTVVYIHIVEVGGTQVSFPDVLEQYWKTANENNPVSEYTTWGVPCQDSSSRRKRSLSDDKKNVTIGDQSDCQDATGVCNGRLKAGTEYRMRLTGKNSGDSYKTTGYSEPFKTKESGGLTAGEIAAIVICSILFIILVILLILFCIRRKKRSGKKQISTNRGKTYDNVGYDESSRTQKYEVDPAADPPTGYSTEQKTDEAV